jgi:hypothetical protein
LVKALFAALREKSVSPIHFIHSPKLGTLRRAAKAQRKALF